LPRALRAWPLALAAVGLEGVHIHDLRHTGNKFTANAGIRVEPRYGIEP